MLKTDENRNCNFAFPVFDLRRSVKPEVIPEVDDVIKMGLEEYYIVFFFKFCCSSKINGVTPISNFDFCGDLVTLTFDLDLEKK